MNAVMERLSESFFKMCIQLKFEILGTGKLYKNTELGIKIALN